jgi:hypothetical protein
MPTVIVVLVCILVLSCIALFWVVFFQGANEREIIKTERITDLVYVANVRREKIANSDKYMHYTRVEYKNAMYTLKGIVNYNIAYRRQLRNVHALIDKTVYSDGIVEYQVVKLLLIEVTKSQEVKK